MALASVLCTALAPGAASAAATLRVPGHSPTIQGAIDAASDGDTVLVSPGTYLERIDFLHKEIAVESAAGADATIIDGASTGTVVSMEADSGELPILRGFTIRNGSNEGPYLLFGGAIETRGGPALIEHNKVTGNVLCRYGAIQAASSQATIRQNIISDNPQSGHCANSVGGGISLVGSGSAKVLDNLIKDHSDAHKGGGIYVSQAGTPTIAGNLIIDNSADQGGGMYIVITSGVLVTNNVIAGNRARQAGGIFLGIPSGHPGPLVVNNTIAFNEADLGSAVMDAGFYLETRLVNNILVGTGAASVAFCGDYYYFRPPVFLSNDVFNTGSGPAYDGVCTDQTGLNGNISAAPSFVDTAGKDFHLQLGSPAIDAGTNADAPATDIEGNARPRDGDGDGAPATDMGAYEAPVVNNAPDCSRVIATPSVVQARGHKLQEVTLAGASDADGDAVTLTIDYVTQDEPVTGSGDHTSPDAALGFVGDEIQLRAERSPKGNGRVYRIAFSGSDGKGGTCTGSANASVPRKARVPAIDSAPPSFDSFGP